MPMNKGLIVGLVVVVIVILGGGWWLMNMAQKNTSMPTPTPTSTLPIPETTATETEPTGNVVELIVEGREGYKFSPTALRVKQGDTVRVLFKNVAGFHDFVIDEFNVATNQIAAGEEEEVEFVVDKKGTFEFYCSVEDHREKGMVGQLIVE